MVEKITTVIKDKNISENDRETLILKMQNENTDLIKECNILREEKKDLKDHVSKFFI